MSCLGRSMRPSCQKSLGRRQSRTAAMRMLSASSSKFLGMRLFVDGSSVAGIFSCRTPSCGTPHRAGSSTSRPIRAIARFPLSSTVAVRQISQSCGKAATGLAAPVAHRTSRVTVGGGRSAPLSVWRPVRKPPISRSAFRLIIRALSGTQSDLPNRTPADSLSHLLFRGKASRIEPA